MNGPLAQIVLVTRTEDATTDLGAAVGSLVREGDVIALHGELGAGKTRFVRGVARGMGINPRAVHSPTFVLANEYDPARPGAPALVHVDAHRLDAALGPCADSLGWDRIADGSTVVAVEWADRLADALPEDRLDVLIEHVSEDERRVTLTATGPNWVGRLHALNTSA